ncbi:MAG TPA: glycosyltransferase family 4 protein [Steroidobacteraceae bacterium]|jgi:glycosyltransferase involved in cell wall biosynthesis
MVFEGKNSGAPGASQPAAPRICFVGLANLPLLAPQYGPERTGGAELQQVLLAKALARRGLPVSMIVADHGQADGAVWHGITTHKACAPRAGLPVLRFVHPHWTSLWSALKRANADVYYTSCAGALIAQVAMFTRSHSRKVVFRIASASDCDPRTLLIRYWRDKQLYRYGLRRADLVLAQTEEQRQAMRRNFQRDSTVVAPLLDQHGQRRDFSERDIDVLWVGNIRSLKRPDRVLELARRLRNARVHIVGGPYGGFESLFESVRREAAELPNVQFHGRVPYAQVQSLYERARLLVGTSEIEGFPNTYLQAWAHGAPVVAFLDPDRLIAHHDLGTVVSSVDELQSAVAALLDDPLHWQRASERCRRYIDARFEESAMVAPYVAELTGLFQSLPMTLCNSHPE